AQDFLVTATPGAGKTRFALAVASRLLADRVIQRVIVVTPTDHLRAQWAAAANDDDLPLDPSLSNSAGPISTDFAGCVVTYAQVAAAPMLHRARTENRKTLVILDEIHHAGDGLSWGEAVKEAFDPARRRLAMTGTPFRTSAVQRIPFVHYERDGDDLRSRADYTYGYRQALRDGVVRPVMFAAYAGVSRWRNSAGEVIAASLTEPSTSDVVAQAWRTALNPRGGWIPHVLAAADERLSEVRRAGMPDAGGLVLASGHADARAYAAVLEQQTGVPPVIVLSDDPKASDRIESFRTSADRWMVAVRMVSEGVDVPRLAVGVYATNASTALFFAQATGRFVRARRPGETATVFLPSVKPLLVHAASLEQERNHVLAPPPVQDEGGLLDPLPATPSDGGSREGAEFLDAQAEFAHLIFDGAAHTGEQALELDELDADFVGLPGLLSAEQTAALLRRREVRDRGPAAEHPGGAAAAGPPASSATEGPSEATSAQVAALRREINTLVAQVAARTGRSHAAIHAQLRTKHGGVPSARATLRQLQARRDYLLGL
ncbi:MAG: DEAD/DEAH box helicase, partial [Actinomycetota bacterium]|nr:DEAD/DEAH box helicase [Actinomycetota bacterium]